MVNSLILIPAEPRAVIFGENVMKKARTHEEKNRRMLRFSFVRAHLNASRITAVCVTFSLELPNFQSWGILA